MQDFRKLRVWERGHELAQAVYHVSSKFPVRETYALTSQLRRAAVSVPANIAEGCGRGSKADFSRFLQIAMGSASEAQYLLLLARDLAYLPVDSYASLDERVAEVKRMLAALIRKLNSEAAIPPAGRARQLSATDN